ncbi:MAG: beta-ketoacyl synthase N-terminal-like domain-containing protein, partial [Hyphococcus sp.]
MNRNVVVTGMGVVAPIGADLQSFWSGLAEGACAITKREFAADDLTLTVPCAPVDGVEERLEGLGRDTARADRVSKLAVAAADEALSMSG